MTMNLAQKIGANISRPFRYIKKGVANLVFGAANSTRSGIKKTIRATGKAAGSMIWDNKLEKLYVETQNNKYVKIGAGLVWLFLFSWIGYKIYTVEISAETTVSLSLAGYLLLASGAVYCFCRDMIRNTSWQQRENIREGIKVCALEKLKSFLLTQNLTAKQKEILSEKFRYAVTNREVIDVYEEIVLREMDKKAEEIVERYSKIVGIGSAVSPRLSWDYLISVLAFSKMLLEIAKAYRVSLSLKTFVSIFIFGLAIISASTIITQAIKQITEKNQSAIALLGGAGAWVISKIVELAIPYYTIGAVGYAIQYTLRPIKPYN